MALSDEDVRKLALLARLELTDEEVKTLGPQLESILGFVEKLAELDTSDVEPMTTAMALKPINDTKLFTYQWELQSLNFAREESDLAVVHCTSNASSAT